MPKSRRNLYLTDGPFEELQKLSPNISQEVDGFIRKRVEELTGQSMGEGQGVDYEHLKERHNSLMRQVEAMQKALSQDEKTFHQANGLLVSLGIEKDFINAADVIPKLVKAWKGEAAYIQEYVSLIEISKERKALTKRLLEIRSGPQKQDPDPGSSPKDPGGRTSSEVDRSQCRAIVLVPCP